MGSVKKIVLMMVCGTALLLGYVHQHILTIQCSYRIQENEGNLAHMIDDNIDLSFQLASLRSPTFLEEKLVAADIDLVLPHEIRIVKVPEMLVPIGTGGLAQSGTSQSQLMRMLNFENEAQAEFAE